jgi:hypothetical protein
MPTQGTYFLNNTVWASGNANSATNIYTEATLTTAAPNGWYKDNNNVYREVTGGNGALGTSYSCTTCGVELNLGYGASAFAACCSGTTADFYVQTSFTATTSIYTNPLLSSFAANQFYSYSSQSREKTSDATDGSGLSSAVSCATCFPAVGLTFGSSSAIACCTGASGTYYMNQTTFATSTILYSTADGTTVASNGFYSFNPGNGGAIVYREVTGGTGTLGTQTTCSDCATSISLCKGTSADDVCCTGCTSLTSFTATIGGNFLGVCSLTPGTTYYHNGSGTYPAAGDTMFTNSAGTAVADPKHYHYVDGTTNKKIHITGTNGYVAGISNCAP